MCLYLVFVLSFLLPCRPSIICRISRVTYRINGTCPLPCMTVACSLGCARNTITGSQRYKRAHVSSAMWFEHIKIDVLTCNSNSDAQQSLMSFIHCTLAEIMCHGTKMHRQFSRSSAPNPCPQNLWSMHGDEGVGFINVHRRSFYCVLSHTQTDAPFDLLRMDSLSSTGTQTRY